MKDEMSSVGSAAHSWQVFSVRSPNLGSQMSVTSMGRAWVKGSAGPAPCPIRGEQLSRSWSSGKVVCLIRGYMPSTCTDGRDLGRLFALINVCLLEGKISRVVGRRLVTLMTPVLTDGNLHPTSPTGWSRHSTRTWTATGTKTYQKCSL